MARRRWRQEAPLPSLVVRNPFADLPRRELADALQKGRKTLRAAECNPALKKEIEERLKDTPLGKWWQAARDRAKEDKVKGELRTYEPKPTEPVPVVPEPAKPEPAKPKRRGRKRGQSNTDWPPIGELVREGMNSKNRPPKGHYQGWKVQQFVTRRLVDMGKPVPNARALRGYVNPMVRDIAKKSRRR